MELTTKHTILEELFKQQESTLSRFFQQVDIDAVDETLRLLLACQGMVVFTGVGKSGLIAKKAAVTMTSTGTRSIFLSPVDALHGDIGILGRDDIFVVISKSGESDELLNLIPFVHNRGVHVIAMVCNKESRLAKIADHLLVLPSEKELCPFDLAPTTSTTIQAIICDILAIALMRHKNFTIQDFAFQHPAGRIGKRTSVRVKDLMVVGEAIPVCQPEDKLIDSLVELSNKQCGCVLIVDEEDKLLGIFTDGDLRRSLQNQGVDSLIAPMQEIMTTSPCWTCPESLAFDALKAMESNQKSPITVLPVLDIDGHVLGLIKMHDIVKAGI